MSAKSNWSEDGTSYNYSCEGVNVKVPLDIPEGKSNWDVIYPLVLAADKTGDLKKVERKTRQIMIEIILIEHDIWMETGVLNNVNSF